jgi:acyl-CoA synthetase (AMP-forming)/AMP-acid ligase II
MTNPYGNFGYTTVTANAMRAPDQVAITYCGDVTITYGELDRRVNRMGHALLAAGVRPGDRVASLLHDSLNVVDVYLAESKIGATIAALNPFWPLDTIVAVAQRSRATAFVYDARFAELVASARPHLPAVTLWMALDVDDPASVALRPLADDAVDTEPPRHGFHDDEWMLLYTSGTTGMPKAVVHSHATGLGISNIWTDVPHSHDSVWGVGPIIWGSGFPSVMGCALYGGVRVALENDFAPLDAIKVIERERVTHLAVVTSFWTEVLRSKDHEAVDLSSLRLLIIGSEPLPRTLLRRIRERLPDVELYTFYGSAEAMYTTFGPIDEDDEREIRPSGRARAACAVKVVDQDGRRVLGTVGTLCHAGPHVTPGYLDQPELNAQVLRDGWFVGEDLGIQDANGEITVLGRRADAISTGGEWVQPAIVEDAALSLPGVAEAGAVGVPEGADEQQILLAVALEAGVELEEKEVALHLEGVLPASRRPAVIVVAESLPHNEQAVAGTGKLLRSAIRDRWGHLVAR